MVMLQPDFVYGVVRKSLVLGAISAIITLLAVSAKFALAVAIGTAVSAINLRFVALSIKKMFEHGREGSASATSWSILLSLKMLILIAIIWVLISRWNVDAVGFVFGFSLFMPAIGWQMWASDSDGSEEDSEI